MFTTLVQESQKIFKDELKQPLLADASAPDLSPILTAKPKPLSKPIKEQKRQPIPLTTDEPEPVVIEPTSFLPDENSDDPESKIKTDVVKYRDPDFESYDKVKPNSFIHKADTDKDFLTWVKDKKSDWVRKPNAETDRELMIAVNGRLPEEGFLRALAVGTSAVLTTPFTLGYYAYQSQQIINPGEIFFSDKAGKLEIRVEQGKEPRVHWLVNPRHSWGKKYSAKENLIQEGNVTIVRILPWEIGLATDNGKPVVLLPGRHAYNSAVFKLEKSDIKSIYSPMIKFGNISIVQINANELGLAQEAGNSMVLLPGLHIRNYYSFQLDKRFSTKDSTLHCIHNPEEKEQKKDTPLAGTGWFSNGTTSIIQIEKGKLGCAFDGTEPILLKPGIHMVNTQAFKMMEFIDATKQHIQFSTINIVRVPKGQIGLGWDYSTNRAVILPEGEHQFNTQNFKFNGFKSLADKKITHGNYTRIIVNAAEYGYAWDHGKAVELAPGIHEKTDPQFIFAEFKSANEPFIQFGNIAHVIVKAGEARAVWDAGKLKVLREGVHHFDSSILEIASKPISLQAVIHTMHDIHVTTRDRMPMHVTGQVVYEIEKPETLISGLAKEEAADLNKAIEKRAAANLREQFSHVDLSMISPDHHQHGEQKDGEQKEEDSRLFGNKSSAEGDDLRGQLCTRVMQKLSKDAEKWGIKIIDFEMLDVGCQNKVVEESLAEATAKTRQTEAKYDLQVAENATTMIKEKAEVERELMKERRKAEISKIHTQTEADTAYLKVEQKAKAEAKAKEIETQATIDAMLKIAKAKMEAAKLEAEGIDAINTAQMKLLDHPGYLELEKAKLQVQSEAQKAKRSTPAVVFGSDGGRSAEAMFFGEGTNLVKLALQQKGPYRSLSSPSSPKAALKDDRENVMEVKLG